ncbi:transcriptional regulator, SARP family protein [Pseudofrankia sp. BMG5.36]|nr:transcriptional regulator, SARP family protein [Pseudofrankia sp. BMG5.36]
MGPLRIWRDGVELDAGPRQQRCVLALLLVRAGRPVSTSDLVSLIWETAPPVSAVNVIHKYVGALRRLLEPDLPPRAAGVYLLRHSTGYRFVANPEMLDLALFRRRVAAAKMSVAEGRPREALDRYVDALGLCHGSTGDALADSAAVSASLAGVDGEFFDAAVAATDLAVRANRSVEVLAALRLAVEMGRFHEPVHASLVTALAAAGHQAEALAAYRTIRDRLAEDLGIDPGRGLREAQQRVLTQAVVPPTPRREHAEPVMPTAVPRLVPPIRPAQLPSDQPLFVGRKAELVILRDLVTGMRGVDRTSPLVIAVDGMGGVGKSTVVTHFAHLAAGEFGDGQLYLDLQGHEGEDGGVAAGDALRSLLYALGVRASDVPDTFDALIGTYRSLTAGKRFLVLLDNVRDASQVRPLLPNSADSLVLITSRRPLLGLAASDGARLLRAHPPQLPEARELLRTRLAAMRSRTFAVGADTGTLDEIIESCGRLPLALAVLGARLGARPQLSLESVAAELRDGARRLEAFPGGRGVIDPRTAFSWSYRQLTPEAARLFRLLSVALTPGITVEACVSLSGRDLRCARAALEELTEAALLTEDATGHFTSHVLVKAYAQELLLAAEPPAERRAALTRLLQHYLHSSSNAELLLEPHRTPIVPPPALPSVVAERPASYQEALDWFARHRDVLKEAVRVAAEAGYGIVPWHLAVTMQWYLEWYGFFQGWEDVMRLALRAAREQGDVIGEAHVLRSLAGARWYFGANEEALDLLRASLAAFAAHDMLPEQAMVQLNLCSVHTALGRHDLALAHIEKAVALSRGAGHRRAEIRSLDYHGRSLSRLGRHEEAVQVLQEALDLDAKMEEHQQEEGSIRVAVAQNLATMGRLDEAVDQLKLAFAIAARLSPGPGRATAAAPQTAIPRIYPMDFEAIRSLTELLISVGDVSGALEAFGRAREVLESLQDGGPDRMRAGLRALAEKLTQLDPSVP